MIKEYRFVFWINKFISLFILCFTITLFADYFLPANSNINTVYDVDFYYPRKTNTAVCLIYCTDGTLYVPVELYNMLDKGDVIKVSYSPIFELTKTISTINKADDQYYSFPPDHGVFKGYLVMPFILLGLSLFAVLHNNKLSNALTAGLLGFILFIYLLFLMFAY